MAYRYGDRAQGELFPPRIEDYVPTDAPVRAYDAMVGAMDLQQLGIKWDPNQVGNSSYDPQTMLKLLVYGYSYGIRSSRKLERACHYDISFIWLMGGLKPDHKTIAEFRRKNPAALKNVLSQCARVCIRLDLIEGNTLFIDGSKMRANASIKNSWTSQQCHQAMQTIDRRITQILQECESTDQAEETAASWVKMQAELQDQQRLKAKVQSILQELKAADKKSHNTTDGDCRPIHSRQGQHAGYTGQIVVDDKHGLIVHGDAASINNDRGQFGVQMKAAQEVLAKPCQTGCGDSGYNSVQDLAREDLQHIDIIVPSPRQVSEKPVGPFDKSRFVYDPQVDGYRCPAGKLLVFGGYEKKRNRKKYMAGKICLQCRHFGQCTTNRVHGRKVIRLLQEEFLEQLERRYEQPDAQAIFARRKMKVEHPFGHFKRNLGVGHFLLRRLAGVRAEWSLLASCFNIVRLIGILGVPQMIEKLQGITAG